MQMFTEQSIVLREICNGIMFLSAVAMIAIFIDYILRARREYPSSWQNDIAVRGAGAIIILMSGHAIRALNGWVEFLLIDLGHGSNWLANAIELFLVATVLIVVGKMLMVFAFARYKWRWIWTLGTVAFAVLIPILTAIVAALV